MEGYIPPYTRANNFYSNTDCYVDPRTGLFKISIPLARLNSCRLAGPMLSLSLSYHPISVINEGFGQGFKLSLTRYNVESRRLRLATGEEYQVTSGGSALEKKKFKNFIFERKDQDRYRIVHKSGLIEELSRYGKLYVPVLIKSQDERVLRLKWRGESDLVRLTEVTDQDGVNLCSFSYSNAAEALELSVLPDDKEAGHRILFEHSDNGLLLKVRFGGADNQEGWSLGYDKVGPRKNHTLLTRMISSTGLSESVIYSTNKFMLYPDGIGKLPLPCVQEHRIQPGAGQPDIVKRWEWTTKNYLGRDSYLSANYLYQEEVLLDFLLPQYVYGSIEKLIDTESNFVISAVTRRYNSFHQLVSQSVLRDRCLYSISMSYYSRYGASFNEQPENYLFPSQQTETWEDSNGKREHVTQFKFDKEGDLIYQRDHDGVVTEYTYYDNVNVQYEFISYLKTKKITPGLVIGDEPVILQEFFWQSIRSPSGGAVIRPLRIEESCGSRRITTERNFYDEPDVHQSYGREKSRKITLKPDISKSESYSYLHEFSYEMCEKGFLQNDKLTTHDNLTVTHTTVRHPILGYLLSQTDMQKISTVYGYDHSGRVLSCTHSPGTEWERSTTFSYGIDETGSVLTQTDGAGCSVKTFFDKAGREIKQQYLDRQDKNNVWRDISSKKYSAANELIILTDKDWQSDISEQHSIDYSLSYDGWGSIVSRSLSFGLAYEDELNPVLLKNVSHVSGFSGNSAYISGSLTSFLSTRNGLPETQFRVDTSNRKLSSCHYSWDGINRLRSILDEVNAMTTWEYDDFGRVVTETLSDGTIIRRSWASHLSGNQITNISVSGKDADGHVRTWNLGTQKFDGLGRLTEQVSCGRKKTFSYEGGMLAPATVTLPSGKIVKYTYIPELGNSITSVTTNGIAQTFSYDPLTGNLLVAKDDESNTLIQNTWNTDGKLVGERFTLGVRSSVNTYYSRTLCGLDASYSDVTNNSVTYERDLFGRVTTIKDADLIAELKYDQFGRLFRQEVKDTSTGGWLTTQLEFDDFAQEISRTIKDSNGLILALKTAYRQDGLIRRRVTYLDGHRLKIERYSYDARKRLSRYKAIGPSGSLPLDRHQHQIIDRRYYYDALNNLTKVSTRWLDNESDIMSYFYENMSDPTQLTRVTHTHSDYPQAILLKYDIEGRLILDEFGRQLNYDSLGRLTDLHKDNEVNVKYEYDALNRLVRQTAGGTNTWQLYYRGNELVNEFLDPGDNQTRLIKYGNDCLAVKEKDRLIQTACTDSRTLLWARDDNSDYLRLKKFEPYGFSKTNASLPGFNNERPDPVSGNYHLGNGYRTYSPELMRFNNPDSLSPFGAGGINPYAYCGGDPVNNTDPSGHIGTWGWLSIGIGAIGLGLALFTGGMSISAAGGIISAIDAASNMTLVIGGLGVIADTTAIASGLTEDGNPDVSAALGWASLGIGTAGLVAGLGKAGIQSARAASRVRAPVVMGGTMKNLDSLGHDIYLFDDVYKSGSRLNIVAHGALQSDGTALLSRGTAGGDMTATELYEILNKRTVLSKYANIRTIMCHSGSGGSLSFGQKLAKMTSLPVKSYRGTVTGNFEVNSLNKLLLEAAMKHGDMGLNYMKNVFEQRHAFRINKTNPYSLLSFERLKWHFEPVKFLP